MLVCAAGQFNYEVLRPMTKLLHRVSVVVMVLGVVYIFLTLLGVLLNPRRVGTFVEFGWVQTIVPFMLGAILYSVSRRSSHGAG